ncbi:hypothetical protein [Geminicoccus flavidas]|uniref:hypothetical protein n=1 Tax=Geminicoccus flavidas TaxID=2506407 RepID=UPI0013598D1A|nr:hypothetical protein [Geminicoccus flavidas]
MSEEPFSDDPAEPRRGAVRVEVQLSADTMALLDRWRSTRPERPSRSDVIRQIVEAALHERGEPVLPGPEKLEQVMR